MTRPYDIALATGAWDYAALGARVRLGRNAWIERPECFERCRSTREPAVVLGDDVRVFGWTTFNLEPGAEVVVGDRSTLVGAVLMVAERVEIGADLIVSHGVTIAACDFHPLDPLVRRADAEAGAPCGDPSRPARCRRGRCGSATARRSASARSCSRACGSAPARASGRGRRPRRPHRRRHVRRARGGDRRRRVGRTASG